MDAITRTIQGWWYRVSGGRFNYADEHAKHEIFDYADKPTNVFEDVEISELVWDVFNLIHDYDWYASGDTGKGWWNKAKKEFKAKWLTPEGQKARYEKYIDDAVAELKNVIGVYGEAFCHNCASFTEEENSIYGTCKFQKHCKMHKYDNGCGNWKEKTDDAD